MCLTFCLVFLFQCLATIAGDDTVIDWSVWQEVALPSVGANYQLLPGARQTASLVQTQGVDDPVSGQMAGGAESKLTGGGPDVRFHARVLLESELPIPRGHPNCTHWLLVRELAPPPTGSGGRTTTPVAAPRAQICTVLDASARRGGDTAADGRRVLSSSGAHQVVLAAVFAAVWLDQLAAHAWQTELALGGHPLQNVPYTVFVVHRARLCTTGIACSGDDDQSPQQPALLTELPVDLDPEDHERAAYSLRVLAHEFGHVVSHLWRWTELSSGDHLRKWQSRTLFEGWADAHAAQFAVWRLMQAALTNTAPNAPRRSIQPFRFAAHLHRPVLEHLRYETELANPRVFALAERQVLAFGEWQPETAWSGAPFFSARRRRGPAEPVLGFPVIYSPHSATCDWTSARRDKYACGASMSLVYWHLAWNRCPLQYRSCPAPGAPLLEASTGDGASEPGVLLDPVARARVLAAWLFAGSGAAMTATDSVEGFFHSLAARVRALYTSGNRVLIQTTRERDRVLTVLYAHCVGDNHRCFADPRAQDQLPAHRVAGSTVRLDDITASLPSELTMKSAWDQGAISQFVWAASPAAFPSAAADGGGSMLVPFDTDDPNGHRILQLSVGDTVAYRLVAMNDLVDSASGQTQPPVQLQLNARRRLHDSVYSKKHQYLQVSLRWLASEQVDPALSADVSVSTSSMVDWRLAELSGGDQFAWTQQSASPAVPWPTGSSVPADSAKRTLFLYLLLHCDQCALDLDAVLLHRPDGAPPIARTAAGPVPSDAGLRLLNQSREAAVSNQFFSLLRLAQTGRQDRLSQLTQDYGRALLPPVCLVVQPAEGTRDWCNCQTKSSGNSGQCNDFCSDANSCFASSIMVASEDSSIGSSSPWPDVHASSTRDGRGSSLVAVLHSFSPPAIIEATLNLPAIGQGDAASKLLVFFLVCSLLLTSLFSFYWCRLRRQANKSQLKHRTPP